jgi:hypothetical protein
VLGFYYFNNGDRYEGDWINNVKEGKGKCYYVNGDVYEGEYKDNKRNGIGKFEV